MPVILKKKKQVIVKEKQGKRAIYIKKRKKDPDCRLTRQTVDLKEVNKSVGIHKTIGYKKT
jgi:hypothetical protein